MIRLKMALMLACFLYISQVQARDFLILGTPEAPFRTGVSQAVEGIDVDILTLVMTELNISYKIKLIDSGSRIIKEMQLGTADMALSFSIKEERRAYLTYPQESYKDIAWNFFIRKEDWGRIKFETLSDLKGLTIGATQDWSYTPEFWNSELTLDVIPYNSSQLKKLLYKRIDVVPMNTVSALYEAKKNGYLTDITYLPKPLKTKQYYNAFSRHSRYPKIELIIKRYDEIIARMKEDGTIQKIYDEYLQ